MQQGHTRAAAGGVQFDAHGVEPIPPSGRDSSPHEQFWIWAGANLARSTGCWARSASPSG